MIYNVVGRKPIVFQDEKTGKDVHLTKLSVLYPEEGTEGSRVKELYVSSRFNVSAKLPFKANIEYNERGKVAVVEVL